MLADEQERSVEIKSMGASLHFEHDEDDGKGSTPHLLNFIDLSGQVEFSFGVTAAIHTTCGAMVVLVCINCMHVPTHPPQHIDYTEQSVENRCRKAWRAMHIQRRLRW